MKTFPEVEAELAALIPQWKRARRPAAYVWGYIQRQTPGGTLGQYEALAGVTDREAFWLNVAREAGPGRDESGEWKDLKLGLGRLKWRWAVRIMRRLRK